MKWPTQQSSAFGEWSPQRLPAWRSSQADNQPTWLRPRLNAMHVRFKSRLPWPLTFSFSRAIQQPALEIWKGDEAHVSAAQKALYHRANCNRAARRGEYNATLERDLDSSNPGAGESEI